MRIQLLPGGDMDRRSVSFKGAAIDTAEIDVDMLIVGLVTQVAGEADVTSQIHLQHGNTDQEFEFSDITDEPLFGDWVTREGMVVSLLRRPNTKRWIRITGDIGGTDPELLYAIMLLCPVPWLSLK